MSTVLASTRDRQMLAATPAELRKAQQVMDDLGTNPSSQLGMNRAAGEDLLDIPRELVGRRRADSHHRGERRHCDRAWRMSRRSWQWWSR